MVKKLKKQQRRAKPKNKGRRVVEYLGLIKSDNRRKRRTRMELAIAGATTLAVLFWIATIIASTKSRETWLVWSVYFAMVFSLLVFFLNWQKSLGAKPAKPDDQEILKRAVSPSVAAGLTLNKKLAANEIVEVSLTFLNGGGGVAENLAGEVGFVYQNKRAKPEASLCATGTTFGPINLLAHAQIPILFRGLTPLPAADLTAIENGSEWLFFCGKASYEGINGHVPIDLCWMYRRQTKEFSDCSDLGNPHGLQSEAEVVITGAKLREALAVGSKPRTLLYFLNNGNERGHVTVINQSVLYAPNTFKGPFKYQPMNNEPAEFELSRAIPYTLDTVWDIVITEAMTKELEANNASIYFYFQIVSRGETIPYCFRYNRATLPDLPLCPASIKVEK